MQSISIWCWKKIWYIKLIDHYLQEKNKKVIGLMKDESGGKITTEFVALIPKTYSYLMDDGSNYEKN